MDAHYFLKNRAAMIRFFYSEATKRFIEIKRRIEAAEPPYDNPPWDDSGEPPYLKEWIDADTATELLGTASIAMLSDSIKLYFKTLQEHVIGFSFADGKSAFKRGFVAAHREALREILDTDWSDCPVDFDLIEQIVLTRNRTQHGENLTSFNVTYSEDMLKKHQQPFFIRDEELLMAAAEGEALASLLMPIIRIDGQRLHRAVQEVEALADWIMGRSEQVYEWRQRQRSQRDAN